MTVPAHPPHARSLAGLLPSLPPASGGQTANVAGDSNIVGQADRGSSVNITR